ncbi:3-deoxy-7-phosphoheptulonate synthase [Streptomyces sp. NPDC091387]|uniref:3-deoxy-7-phosphoheptulonate synthase n=1 Tax=Streptomyces sp. NPDC091387 TaxID=3365998 RepID=UPI003807C39F
MSRNPMPGAEHDPLIASMVAGLPARQQPQWPDPSLLPQVRERLAGEPPLVSYDSVKTLGALLARAAEGEFCLLQAGDCVELTTECEPRDIARKVEMLDVLGDIMCTSSGLPVLRVGRIAGQFSKPRSQDWETVYEDRLPVFRGPVVNAPDPQRTARTPDPSRILAGMKAARRAVTALDQLGRGEGAPPQHRVWTSHEALLLDYELPQVRRHGEGGSYLASAHWPWIGERTRQADNAHVRLMAELDNPVACKIGPEATVDEVLAVCAVLDPHRTPGRLTLIARFGAGQVARVAPLVRAVKQAGHPVLWMCDPMHGNTVKTPDGLKTRKLDAIMSEIRQCIDVVSENSGRCAGLHLEASPDDISECEGAGRSPVPGPGYRSLCDPRLSLVQAVAAAAHWRLPVGAAA